MEPVGASLERALSPGAINAIWVGEEEAPCPSPASQTAWDAGGLGREGGPHLHAFSRHKCCSHSSTQLLQSNLCCAARRIFLKYSHHITPLLRSFPRWSHIAWDEPISFAGTRSPLQPRVSLFLYSGSCLESPSVSLASLPPRFISTSPRIRSTLPMLGTRKMRLREVD